MPAQQFEKITHQGVQAMFFRRLEAAPEGWVTRLSMRVDSSSAVEEYGFLGMVPQMREWIGGREAKYLREYSFNVRNKDFEATLGIKDKDMRRDKTGQLRARVDELADRVLQFPAKLMSNLILSGEAGVCYDKQFFFDTDHAEGESGAQSNDLTVDVANPLAPTTAEMADAILTAVSSMYGFKDDRGEPINEGGTTFDVMVPISLWKPARAAVSVDIMASGGGTVTNPLTAGGDLTINVIPNPRLSAWTSKFTVMRADAGGAKAPFIIQEEAPIALPALGEGSDHFFKHKEHLFSAEWSGNVAYGDWRSAVLVTLT
ncbi:Mu-like prophage major head subunit gpT [Stappia sp. 22II-S9-Z10]|nr:Mu-like prophage major head subunit gpT [Stappia sp. 22II-S9-Z10]